MKKTYYIALFLLIEVVVFNPRTFASTCTGTISDSHTPGTADYTFTLNGSFSAHTGYTWDYGDNTNSGSLSGSAQTVTHTYANNGTYTVSCLFGDTANQCSNMITTSITVTTANGSSGCSSTISYSHSGPAYIFVCQSTGLAPLQYSWYVSNSFYGSGVANITDNLPDSGTYSIEVIVTDATNCIDTAYYTLHDSGYAIPPCSTVIHSTNIDSFYTLHTQNTGTGPFTFMWTLPDGSTSTLPDPTYIIGSSGSYLFTVIVTDSLGCIDTVSKSITYSWQSQQPCDAYFVVVPDTTAGYYTAINYSVGSGSLNYDWWFGDGTTSTLQYPSHTYAIPGYYAVCLTIVDSSVNCVSQYCDTAFYAYKNNGGPMSELTVQGSNPTGVQQVSGDLAVSIYPNPARSVLGIRIGDGTVIQSSTIYTITGQRVDDFGPESELNISNLVSGMYFIKIKTTSGNTRSSFVKQE